MFDWGGISQIICNSLFICRHSSFKDKRARGGDMTESERQKDEINSTVTLDWSTSQRNVENDLHYQKKPKATTSPGCNGQE